MKARVLPAVLFIAFGVVFGCNTDHQSTPAKTPSAPPPPLFTPQTASLSQQKMCAEQAAQKFRLDGYKNAALAYYTSHYDPSVNVCYVRVHDMSGNPPTTTDVVYDAFGGRVYANYLWINSQNKKYWEVSPIACHIRIPGRPDETCKTAEEFGELTEKYFGVAQ